ncbi:MAG: C1 family peptidase [Acidobacteria bacterium]|nr:C1 family peptidase [Acidobacteriota bacterium]
MSPKTRLAALKKERPFTGVTKDPLDLRDLMYEGSLLELPFKLDNRKKVPRILDQQQEGACTGFGLAAVVNFLMHSRQYPPPMKDFASPRMLYEMARRYDEWRGENYDGSSIRGAMKGWHRHGVCRDDLWRYVQNEPGTFTKEREKDARRRPLGSYFRVRHLHLNHMQSALREAGVLYASSDVHEGWYDVNPRTGEIPFSRKKAGGHAFAIVGYDESGFWIQNSWGPGWGLKGFCKISYDDWLENSYDCWVARLGVPAVSAALSGEAARSRVATFDYIPHEEVVQAEIRPHYVSLGNDGRFDTSGRYSTGAEEVDRIIRKELAARMAAWRGRKRLALYAHGGLNSEKAAASRIASLRPYFLGNRIYPLSFIWHTGLWDSFNGIVQDAFRRDRLMGWRPDMKERFKDLIDEAVELGARPLGRPIWRQIKDNARRASAELEGGARFVASRLAAHASEHDDLELHLIGHSAGSIFYAYLIPVLVEMKVPIKTLTLYAAACTTELFKSNILPHVGGAIRQLAVFNLNDETERADSVGPAYNKSLLYLVSEALEEANHDALLGMEKFLTADAKIKKALGKPAVVQGPTVIYTAGVPQGIKLASRSTSHGGFDNDEATLDSTLRIITGSNTLARSF